MRNILCLFDYVARTGFGTVSKNIVAELKKKYGSELKLHIVAINYFGEPYYEDENTYVVPAKINDIKQDDFGRYFFLKLLADNDYDGFFICQDLGTIISFVEVLEHIKKEKKENNRKVFKSIFYFPVDCKIIYELTKGLEFFDLLVTYNEFARKEINRLRPELKVKVLPHGNNSKEFYPLPTDEIKKFRQEYFEENADKFIITNINRNQPRKDYPSTIFGFIEAKKIWNPKLPKPFLYLHTHPNDPKGWDLRAILMQTDLIEDEDFKILPKQYEAQMCPTEMVNQIYNASDVYLTTTLGEGWGLGFSEAAACRVPIVAPYNTSFIEMSEYGKNAFMVMTMYPYVHTNDNIIREQSDIYEIGEALLNVAECKFGIVENGQKILNDKVDRAYKWVKKLEWKDICKQWVEYFKIY